MPKLPPPSVRSVERGGRDELSDLMALLGETPDEEPVEAVDAGDLAELLEEIGASAKEREEQEMQELLERLPELADETSGRELVPTVDAPPDESYEIDEDQAPRIPVLVGVPVSRQPMPISMDPAATGAPVSIPAGPALPVSVIPERPREGAAFTLVVEDDHGDPVTFRELFGKPESGLDRERREGAGREDDHREEDDATAEEPLLPPLRDALGSRRALADKRLRQFILEDVKTVVGFRILRLLMVSGIDRVSLEDLREELVEGPETLRPALEALAVSGLLVQEPGGYAINPRARKLALLGTAVARWQQPRHRDQIWGWLHGQA